MSDSSSGLWGAAIGVAGTVVVGALALAGALGSGWFSYASKDEELKVHLVEIAIGILRADPKEDVAPARGWAMDVIDRYSGVKFSAEDRGALLHKPIKATGLSYSFMASPTTWDSMLRNPNVLSDPDILRDNSPHKP